MQPQVFQRENKVYIVAPVSLHNPGQGEIEQFAFADTLKQAAPNEHIMWLKGHYVEAENANANGQMWTAGELSLKHLTPRLMPVTIMHDPSTAVGLIADASLNTPENDGVPRSRIDTVLALWQHRFPEIAEECRINYEQGTLMQSMECIPGYFECADCGRTVPNAPGLVTEDNLCDHMAGRAGESPPRRILSNVVFTGTGLIFGTRGSQGAYKEAYLDISQDEIAEFHAESHKTKPRRKPSRSKPKMGEITIEQSEYAELQKRPTKDELEAEKQRADQAEQKATDAESAKEEAEIAQKKAEDEKAEADKKLAEAEEKSEKEELSKERMGKLGEGFLKKLPESVSERLESQAKEMSQEDWDARIEELSSMVGVESDEGAEEPAEGEEEFSEEQIASTGAGSKPSGAGKEPNVHQRAGVFGGLFDQGKK